MGTNPEGGHVKDRKLMIGAVVTLAALVALAVAATGSARTGATKASVTVALVSDIGKFNDRSFNQFQLEGLNRAKAKLGITALPLQSNSVSDYLPNLTSAIRKHANVVISAGFLLANATATVAKKFPNTHFAITDYPVEIPPFATKKGKVLFKNVEGLTYNANEGGCLAGVLAALQAKKDGAKAIGAVGGLKIPPVDIWIAGYKFCARKAVPGTKVLVGYSQDFVAADKCKTVAENLISQGADVLFQVAGGCGLGTLKAADEAGKWGIGVDKDQYKDAKRVLTSAFKRVDAGVFAIAQQEKTGAFAGGKDTNFNLSNGGIGLGRINPAVPKSSIAMANKFKAQIIAGKLKVPTAL
ncbi:MAG: BMP family ABC transporter substrate-binding protein [Actinobacteria bacterium]|nr:MAG: BMP family ABC transporter substrate-binding protein [Actinomycetota bacterium]